MQQHILVVYSQHIETYKKHFINTLEHKLTAAHYNIINCISLQEAYEISHLNPRIVTIIYDWDDFGFDSLHQCANKNHLLPIFVITNKHTSVDMNLSDFNLTVDFLQYDTNLIEDDVQRILLAIKKYQSAILPPFTKALIEYLNELNYAFCTPGHLGGTAFQKTPVSAAFYDFFGSNIFRADLSISIEELGSLMDHSGVHRDAENFIAQTFASDRSLIVTNGTSTANKIVGMYSATAGDTVVIDRNCHESLAHFLMMVDVIPIYLIPTRNAYGILGGISQEEFTSISDKIAKHQHHAKWPTYAVITNSTYDGIFYAVHNLQEILQIRHLHFDSAWAPYTKFHPIYANKFGLSLTPKPYQVIFETHSTHKLLAAFSQSSMIHIKGQYNAEILNINYMMHTSTSPFYPLIASSEISAAMMHSSGHHLMTEAIHLALDFRLEIKKLKKQSTTWYFDVWQPDNCSDIPTCFPLKSKDKWHGFKNISDQQLFLDPIKVTILLPGIIHNKLDSWGIPAFIVEKFLAEHGIIVEKTGPYSMLFLFSLGITQAKSMALLAALNQFKQFYDQNLTIKKLIPKLYQSYPNFYANMTIQNLSESMHKLIQKHDLPKTMYHAFDLLPNMIFTPHQAYQKLIKQEVKLIPIAELKDQIAATMILPYPPGVPLIMPGEQITDACLPILEFLLMLDDIGRVFPGFAIMIHGTEIDAIGNRYVQVIVY